MSHTQKHRHYVVFPMVVMALCSLVGVQTLFPLRGLYASSVSFDTMIPLKADEESLPSGTHVSLDKETMIATSIDGTRLQLQSGGALLDVLGYAELLVGCVRIEALHSVFYTSTSSDTLTIASVEGPLLVRLCSGASRLLSDQRQFVISSDGSTTQYSVDQSWRRSQLAKVEPLESAMSIHSDTSVAFPQSKADRSLLLAKFFAQSGSSDPEQFSVALKQIDTLDTDGFLRVLFGLMLMRSSSSSDADDSTILRALDSAPALRSDAVEAILRSLVISPLPLSKGVHNFWQKNAQTVAVAQPEFMLALLKDASVLPTLLDEQQLPKQALLWRQAFSSILQTLEALLPSSFHAEVMQVQSLMMVADVQPEPPQNFDASRRDVVKPLPVDVQDLTQRTKDMLFRFGALFTAHTTFTVDPTDPFSIRVTGILIAEQGKDVPYEFSYTPTKNLLHSFVRDAVRLPNALTPEQFFGHMKKASM